MSTLRDRFFLGKFDWFLVSLALILIMVANAPNVIALRYLLLGGLLLSCFADSLRNRQWPKFWCPPVCLFLIFLLFAFLHAIFISHWQIISLSETYNQYIVGFVWFACGMLVFSRWRGVSFIDFMIIIGAITVVIELLWEFEQFVVTGVFPFAEIFTMVAKMEFTFFMNLILAFLVSAFCFGGKGPSGGTVFPKYFLAIVFFLIIFVSLRAGARNGMIGLVYLSLSMYVVYVLFERRRVGVKNLVLIGSIVISGVLAVSIYAIGRDQRNSVFKESAEAGWNYKQTKAWLREEPYPKMSNGEQVDPSAYERIAWIHSGLDLINESPLGYGFARNTFSRSLTWTGQSNHVEHSHSGFINLGIGLGIPGIILWVMFCLSLIFSGYRAFLLRRDVLGLALVLVTTGFLGRMVLDTVNKDHMLHIFLFSVGAMLAELYMRESKEMPTVSSI